MIFDLDGTLVDTLGGIARACNQVLAIHGYKPHEKGAYAGYVGSGLGNTLTSALPKDILVDKTTIDLMKQQFVEVYEKDPLYDTAPYEGIKELLAGLKARGIQFGVHTNKHQHIADAIFDHCFKDEISIGLRGSSDVTKHKPSPQGTQQLLGDEIECDTLLFVGDTEVDIATARALNIPVVAVSWGFRDGEVLKACSPDLIIDHPMELIHYIDGLET